MASVMNVLGSDELPLSPQTTSSAIEPSFVPAEHSKTADMIEVERLSSNDELYIQTHLPILHAIFKQLDHPEWTVKFARIGIKDTYFPFDIRVIEKTFHHIGINIAAMTLGIFNEFQYRFFSSPVKGGDHINYTKGTPYMRVFVPGFPASGSFGEVEKVSLYKDSTKIFARKRLLQHDSEECRKRIREEIRLLQTFRHPHSVPYHGSYTYRDQLYLVFDFCDGNLFDFFRSPPDWYKNLSYDRQANKLVNWMIDLASAIAAFHSVGGIHRDLKPENILIKSGTIYVADFGLASQRSHPSQNPASVHGTEKYMAPEQGVRKTYGRSADIFALGCIFLELITFGANISTRYFDTFRRHFGPQICQYSANVCYRHNLDAVHSFIQNHLRDNPQIECLLDIIEFEMLVYRPTMRTAARDLRIKILKLSSKWGFFKKDDCCSGELSRTRYEDASMRSLTEHIMNLIIERDPDQMDIDLPEYRGRMDKNIWKGISV